MVHVLWNCQTLEVSGVVIRENMAYCISILNIE